MVAEARRAPFGWIAVLAFASGFPFGLINEALPVYLRSQGSTLVDVGLVSAATFPWTFKFLWAPFVDRYGTRKVWAVACLSGLAVMTLLLPQLRSAESSGLFWLVLLLMVTLSATQDIAIDAYTIETTPESQLGVANSVRIASYRAAMYLAGGFVIWLAGRSSWPTALGGGAALLAGLALLALVVPQPPRAAGRVHPELWEPLLALVRRREFVVVLLFAILFKLGDSAMEPMTRAFWVDRGLSLEEIGGVLTPGRLIVTLVGAVLGGILTSRWGIFTALWSLGALQAVSNLGYWWAAVAAPSKTLIMGAAFFEQFTGAMGTAAFVSYLMSVCEPRFAATQYALLSAALALTRAISGGFSGGVTERIGYAPYFLLTFFLALPGFALLPRIRTATRPVEVTR